MWRIQKVDKVHIILNFHFTTSKYIHFQILFIMRRHFKNVKYHEIMNLHFISQKVYLSCLIKKLSKYKLFASLANKYKCNIQS